MSGLAPVDANGEANAERHRDERGEPGEPQVCMTAWCSSGLCRTEFNGSVKYHCHENPARPPVTYRC